MLQNGDSDSADKCLVTRTGRDDVDSPGEVVVHVAGNTFFDSGSKVFEELPECPGPMADGFFGHVM